MNTVDEGLEYSHWPQNNTIDEDLALSIQKLQLKKLDEDLALQIQKRQFKKLKEFNNKNQTTTTTINEASITTKEEEEEEEEVIDVSSITTKEVEKVEALEDRLTLADEDGFSIVPYRSGQKKHAQFAPETKIPPPPRGIFEPSRSRRIHTRAEFKTQKEIDEFRKAQKIKDFCRDFGFIL